MGFAPKSYLTWHDEGSLPAPGLRVLVYLFCLQATERGVVPENTPA